MARSFIPVEELAGAPYSGVLGYPRASKRQLTSRVKELGRLGVSAVAFEGPVDLGGVRVLGKGYVGVVVLARRGRRRVALKIRRTDSPRTDMRREAALLQAANSAGAGPAALGSSRNFLLMEYVEGEGIGRWIGGLAGAKSASKLRVVVRGVLEGCYRLDAAGLDHGELSSISKHVIVGRAGPVLIDFESSSSARRPSNVTSAAQAIFIGSGIAKEVQKVYRIPPKPRMIAALRAYKREMSPESFEALLGVLGV